MKPFKILTFLCACLLMQSCSSPAQKYQHLVASSQPVSYFNGHLILGAQTQLFSPCDSQIQYQIYFSQAQLKRILPRIRHPYDELYVELTGNLIPPSLSGYNADYRAILKTAQINRIQEARKRCYPIPENVSQKWVGHYSAQSTKSDMVTTLELHPDHSARTTYHHSSHNELPVVEKGYWQALGTNKVQVVMTLYQQQFLITERVFTKKENTLFADKEKIGQKEYTIAPDGLLLFREK
ncbi:hypothetical protein [Vibrio salinus]|uniref:hypothetical protein n=1 Tax=Vibrio salinus TaxID=2899784 RepID=UPI001E55D12C|nr:hypothetical protein [Vibrio salinus]MCE0493548.1 hypothetical protein [Vibrio salinus]